MQLWGPGYRQLCCFHDQLCMESKHIEKYANFEAICFRHGGTWIYEYNTCTKCIIEEDNLHLQPEDIAYEIDGKTVNLHGALTSVVADNLASNLIGGLKNLSPTLS